MNKPKSYNTWINAGYELFAHEGPEGLQIERLARIINLNKSGFYHYFGTRDIYFEMLTQHHQHNADLMVENANSMLNFMPGYIQFLSEFTIPVLAHMQLQRARHNPLFAKTFNEVNRKVDPAILPLWAAFIELSDNPALALRYFEFFRDTFYARVTPANLSYGFIYAISNEAKEICRGLKHTYSDMVIANQSA